MTQAAASGQVRMVAVTNSMAFGGTLTSVRPPSLNDRGQTAFYANFDNSQSDVGLIIADAAGGLTLTARSGDDAPGTGVDLGFVTASFDPHLNSYGPHLNSNGATATLADLTGPGVVDSNRLAIFSNAGGNGLELVARSGGPAPAQRIPVNFGRIFSSLVFNDAGRAAFMATLSGVGVGISNDFGVLSEGGGNGLRFVAREGSPAPVGGSGVTFSFPAEARLLWSVSLNDHGETAFVGLLSGNGVVDSNAMAIFSEGAGGGLKSVVRAGESVPGAPVGVMFGNLNVPLINNEGRTAFFASLIGLGVSESNDFGFFREGAQGGLELIARDGDAAPGTNPGVHFDLNYTVVSNGNVPRAFNGGGDAAFIARLKGASVTGSNNQAVFSEGGGGELRLVARAGDAVAGLENHAVMGGFINLALNDRGQAAFHTFLNDDNGTRTALFAEDVAGNLRLIARTGDTLDVSNNPAEPDLRIIRALDFIGNTGTQDGRASAFNNRGQLAFRAEFVDGSSGIFVSDLVTVPEPSGVGWTILWAATLLRRRRGF